MCKVYLDTNVLYELLDINHNQKLDKDALLRYINSLDKIYLPSVVISEILIHYRDDDDMLIKILKFIGDSKYEIVMSKYLSFSGNYDMFNLTDESLIRKYLPNFKRVINGLLETKIREESSFMLLFYKISVLHMIWLICKLFSDDQEQELKFLSFFKEGLNIFIAVYDMTFNEALTQGYAYNDEIHLAKSAFSVSSKMSIDFIIYALENLHNYTNKELSSEHKKLLKKLKRYFNEKANEQPLKVMNWLEKKYTTESIENAESEKIETFTEMFKTQLSSHGINEYYVDYIMRMFNRWRCEGNKFEKNDIWDMVVLTSLEDPGSILVVFDDNSYDFLKEKGHRSIEIIDMFYKRYAE